MTDIQFDISTKTLAQLVKPVVPLAHKDGMLPSLNAVRLQAFGKYLTASATDRYKAGMSRVALDPAPPVGLDITIGLAELRQLLSVFKSDVRMERTVTITVLDDRIKVEQAFGLGFLDASMSFPLVKGEFPDLVALFARPVATEPVSSVGLNASHIAEFRHAIRDGEPLVIRSSDQNKPVIITAGDHFLGLLMPTRIASGAEIDALGEWSDIFAAPERKGEPAKTARKSRAKTGVAA